MFFKFETRPASKSQLKICSNLYNLYTLKKFVRIIIYSAKNLDIDYRKIFDFNTKSDLLAWFLAINNA